MYFAHQIEEKHDEKSFQISHIYQVDTKENTCHFYISLKNYLARF